VQQEQDVGPENPLLCQEGRGEVEARDSLPPSLARLSSSQAPYKGEEKIEEQLMARYEHVPIFKATMD
jgi:hypothetical protein